MIDDKPQFYNLLTASMYAQSELLKKIPPTKENIKLLNKHNKHLPNNMSLLELVLNNFGNWFNLLIKLSENLK